MGPGELAAISAVDCSTWLVPGTEMTTDLSPEPELPHRPVLVGLFHVVALDADRVQVANAGRKVVLKGEGFGRRVAPLLKALDGSVTRDELFNRFPDLAPQVLRSLAGRGLLTDDTDVRDTAKAAPRMAATAFPAGPPPAEAAAVLLQASVAVLGTGPTTAAAAVLLSKAGVGRLVIPSSGHVTTRDIVLSPVYQPSDEGRPRSRVLDDLCGDAVITVGERSDLLDECLRRTSTVALVESGYDVHASVVDALLEAGIAYLVHSQDALEATIGPLVKAGGMPCHHCLESRLLSHQPAIDEHLAYRRHRARLSPGPDAFLSAHASLLAGLLATEVLGVILHGPPDRSTVLVINLAEMEMRREEILAVPACRQCRRATQHRP